MLAPLQPRQVYFDTDEGKAGGASAGGCSSPEKPRPVTVPHLGPVGGGGLYMLAREGVEVVVPALQEPCPLTEDGILQVRRGWGWG